VRSTWPHLGATKPAGSTTLPVSAENYLVGRNLALTFHRRAGAESVEVLRDVTFSVPQGSVAALIGPSGCGKTTLLNCMCGLLKPTAGRLWVDGKEPLQARRERYFGLVPQEASLFEWKTVFQNIMLPFQIFGQRQDRHELREQVEHLIHLVGLNGFEHAYPRALSGGMKQRVSLARALSFNPPVLLLDEPFGALDAQTREQMNVEVLRIWSEVENTMVLITHDITEAVLLADRIFVMSARPSSIRAVIDVEIPRPRGREVLDSAELREHAREIRRLLQP
jgi:NitT/TauT family transport system ATP-binding protein